MPEPTVNIASCLEQALRQRQEPAREYFRMSSMGQCPKAQILARAGVERVQPWDRRVLLKMWTGTVVGHGLQDILEGASFLDPAWTERELTYRSYVGHCDGYTAKIPGGAIVEIKTSDDKAVLKPDWPEHYLWQGLSYCLAAKVPNLLLVQLGKNQGLMRHRVVALTEEWVKTINQEIDFLETCWTAYRTSKLLCDHRHRFGWENKLCAYATLEERLAWQEEREGVRHDRG